MTNGPFLSLNTEVSSDRNIAMAKRTKKNTVQKLGYINTGFEEQDWQLTQSWESHVALEKIKGKRNFTAKNKYFAQDHMKEGFRVKLNFRHICRQNRKIEEEKMSPFQA